MRVNVGPKKHGLELLRKKIETQTERISAAQRVNAAAQKAAAQAAEALAAEERVKDQLCQELNLLVQQSARSQLDKLEQLTRRLESVNAGLAIADHEIEPGTLEKASALQQDAEALRGALLVTAGEPEPQRLAQSVANGSAGVEDRHNTLRGSNGRADAEEARGRHVHLPGRQGSRQNEKQSQQFRSCGGGNTLVGGLPQPPLHVRKAEAPASSAVVRESRDARGAFRGFE